MFDLQFLHLYINKTEMPVFKITELQNCYFLELSLAVVAQKFLVRKSYEVILVFKWTEPTLISWLHIFT